VLRHSRFLSTPPNSHTQDRPHESVEPAASRIDSDFTPNVPADPSLIVRECDDHHVGVRAGIECWLAYPVRAVDVPMESRRFRERWIRLEPGETKNRRGRMFHLTPQLRSVLEAQKKHTEALERDDTRIIATVFHRRASQFGTSM